MTNYLYNKKAFVRGIVIAEILLAIVCVLFFRVLIPAVQGFRLEHENWTPVLLAGSVFSVSFYLYYRWKNKSLESFSDLRLLESYMPAVSSGKTLSKYFLLRFAIFFLGMAMINPQLGSKMSEAKAEGMDIMFCLDVSNSMLAEDIQPNRLQRAKRLIGQVVKNLHGDRIGIVIFAGEAFVQLPITTDYSAANLFLNTVETDFVPVQGTAVGQAIDLAYQAFDPESPTAKAIVVITDGENHEDDAVETAKDANKSGVKVYAIGMGSTRGAPIPIKKRGNQVDYKKDRTQQVVVSKLNEKLIDEIANAGEGKAFFAESRSNITDDLISELNQLDKAELDQHTFSDYEDRFQWFLFPALLCLALELLIPEKKRKWKGLQII